ncbi:MAG: DUF63 family protein [Candidatus Hydrothermarchaeaceae archaeon]
MIDFIQKYFIDPIYTGEGYNTYNTIVYGLLLGVGIILAENLLRKLKIDIGERFAFGMLPFISMAALVRSLVDAEVLPRSFFLITPGIFFTTFFMALASLALSKYLERARGIGYHKSLFSIGAVLLVPLLTLVLQNIIAPVNLIYIIVLTGLSSAVTIVIFRTMKFTKKEIRFIVPAHMLDASATFLAVEYLGYFEEHVFENFLIQLLGTALIIFPLKIIVLAIVLTVIKRLESGYFWYFAIMVLGYAPGLRDTLTIVLLG